MSLVALLASVHHRFGQIGISCQAAYAGTTGRVHRSYQSINQSIKTHFYSAICRNESEAQICASIFDITQQSEPYISENTK